MSEPKIKDKIKEIEKYLEELESLAPSHFEEYQHSLEKKAACERYFEKIVEAVVDLAFMVIKEKGLKAPEEEKETFDLLTEEVIPKELAVKLKNAKGMRNILSHQYGNIDDEVVFESITKELDQDVQSFLDYIKRAEQKGKSKK